MEERQRLTDKYAASKAKPAEKKQNSSDARDIGDFEYDKTKSKVLKKALHNISVSVGTLLAAMKDLAMLRGSDITPDGRLGGKGFIMPFKDIKSTINTAISELSDITDTLADELTNPRWGISNKEVNTIKKEQEKAEEKADSVLDKEPESKEESPEESEDDKVEDTEEEKPEEIVPEEDIKDAVALNAENRYRSLLEGPPSADKTAKDLGKIILANLVRGE
jgi:hypothetical protein